MTQNANTPPTQETYQAEQARRVLMRLQWLVIILLGSGIIWLYTAFESVVGRVNDKVAIIDTVDTRLNTIDDRLFALSSTHTHTTAVEDTHNQDSDLIKIELALANQLFEKGNYEDALTALSAIHWQLSQTTTIATPIKTTLIHSLNQDIAHINALKHQPDAWQAHSLKMRELQAFLRQYHSQGTTHTPLTHGDILLYNTNMLLSLAIGAASARDKNLMTTYLQETKGQLQQYIRLQQGTLPNPPTSNPPTNNTDKEPKPLTTIDDALYWVYDLLATSPKDKKLHSMQMLNTH